jgi:hypothetical protein
MPDVRVTQLRPPTISASLQELVRSSRGLIETSIGVGEMELAAAIKAGERLRDGIIAQQVLDRARKVPVFARLRRDGHGAVDLVADLAGAAFIVAFDAAEEMFRAMEAGAAATAK